MLSCFLHPFVTLPAQFHIYQKSACLACMACILKRALPRPLINAWYNLCMMRALPGRPPARRQLYWAEMSMESPSPWPVIILNHSAVRSATSLEWWIRTRYFLRSSDSAGLFPVVYFLLAYDWLPFVPCGGYLIMQLFLKGKSALFHRTCNSKRSMTRINRVRFQPNMHWDYRWRLTG